MVLADFGLAKSCDRQSTPPSKHSTLATGFSVPPTHSMLASQRSSGGGGGGGGEGGGLGGEGLRRRVLSVPTFLLLTVQGLTNSIADRSVSTFQTLWLQNVGFSA